MYRPIPFGAEFSLPFSCFIQQAQSFSLFSRRSVGRIDLPKWVSHFSNGIGLWRELYNWIPFFVRNCTSLHFHGVFDVRMHFRLVSAKYREKWPFLDQILSRDFFLFSWLYFTRGSFVPISNALENRYFPQHSK